MLILVFNLLGKNSFPPTIVETSDFHSFLFCFVFGLLVCLCVGGCGVGGVWGVCVCVWLGGVGLGVFVGVWECMFFFFFFAKCGRK